MYAEVLNQKPERSGNKIWPIKNTIIQHDKQNLKQTHVRGIPQTYVDLCILIVS